LTGVVNVLCGVAGKGGERREGGGGISPKILVKDAAVKPSIGS